MCIRDSLEFFTKCAEEGTPTVYLCFTSALSSSYKDVYKRQALNGLPIALPNNAAIRAFEKEAAPIDTQIRNCLLYTSRCV